MVEWFERLIDLFNSDRDEEYTEVIERCQDFLAEIEKETNKSKFTFAELEDSERDLEKLETWFAKIQERDFFQAKIAEDAGEQLTICKERLNKFTKEVYSRVEKDTDA